MYHKINLILLLVISFYTTTVFAHFPDFTQLVEQNSKAVVKVLVTHKDSGALPQGYNLEDIPPFFREFFERMQPRENDGNQRRERPQGIGSGFIIATDGYIVTNFHVIDKSSEVSVRLHDRSEYQAEVVGVDALSDLAILKITTKEKLHAIEFADSDNVKVGSFVLAIGAPFGLDYSASSGIISAKGRSLPSENGSNYVAFLQTDVAINPGNSGGPLFNIQGKVVGVNSQIYTRSGGYMGLSFAIPSNLIKNVFNQIKENGKVNRGYLGVVIQNVDKDLALSFGLEKPQGALINQVLENSAADKAGIVAGDIIIAVGDKKIVEDSDLPHIVGLISPNTKVKLTLLRTGKKMQLTAKIGSLDGDITQAFNGDLISEKLGVQVADLDSRTKSRLRSKGGVRVEQVLPQSPAAQVGIQEGDIILQLGYELILDSNQLVEILTKIDDSQRIPLRFLRGGRAIFTSIVLD